MTAASPSSRSPARSVLYFLVTFAALALSFAVLLPDRPEFEDVAFDFYRLGDDEVVSLHDLTRKQGHSIKLGFVHHFPPPAIGIFGNHQFQFFARTAFGNDVDRQYFFNFWYANVGLPEVRHYLDYLARTSKLPSDLVVVQITTPNNDMGQNIVNFGGALPDKFINTSLLFEKWDLDEVSWLFDYFFVKKVEARLSYATLLAALSDEYRSGTGAKLDLAPRVIKLNKCDELPSDRWRSRCRHRYLSNAFASDGSFHYGHWKDVMTLKKDGDSTQMKLKLSRSDAMVIARHMRAINDIVSGAGRRLVFVVPPVYESSRRTIADEIFDDALTHVPDLVVIDHRHLAPQGTADETYFADFDHPSEKYFRYLVEELATRQLLPTRRLGPAAMMVKD
jgi:hypothetical protein